MRNEHLPLIQALRGRDKPKGGALPEPPRHFEIKHDEIPGLAAKKVGAPVAVHLKGHIHMQHEDGHAVMHVDSVKAQPADNAQDTH